MLNVDFAGFLNVLYSLSALRTAKKCRLEGQNLAGELWGTGKKVLRVLRNESDATHWETIADFSAKLSLFTYLHPGQSPLLSEILHYNFRISQIPGVSHAISAGEMLQTSFNSNV